mgnify:CR=1 FL=1
MHDVFFQFMPPKALSTSLFFEHNLTKTIALRIFCWYLDRNYNYLRLTVIG